MSGVFMLGFTAWWYFEDVAQELWLGCALLGAILVLAGCWILLSVAERGSDEDLPQW